MNHRAPWHTRRLDRNHACQRPQHFVFVDTETIRDTTPDTHGRTRQSLRLGVACGVDWPRGREPKEEWYEFTEADQFWLWLQGRQRAKRCLWVVAHNAVFDFTILNLWSRLETCEYSIKSPPREYTDPRSGELVKSEGWEGLVAIDGKPFHVETCGLIGRVTFSDLMNYYPCSLKEVGATVGIEKLEMPDEQIPAPWWFAYCQRDVEILKSAYLQLVKRWEAEDNGNWQLSAPALAWSHYRHRHMHAAVVLHEHANARDLEWSGYYPGECRAWYRGRVPAPVVHYDVNSLYPSVMAGHDYPTELIDYIVCPHDGIIDSLCDRYAVIADCTLEATNDEYPFRKDGRIWHPVGRFRTALAGPEFVAARRRGECREVHALAYYRAGRLFDTFVAEWWAKKAYYRRVSDCAGEKFCKLMLNGLPGKFAQRNPAWQFDPRVPVIRPWTAFPWRHPETGIVHDARAIGWQGQYAGHRTDSAHAFPAVAAYVTSYARRRMRELRRDIPPSCCYYQDTDSIFVDAGWPDRPEWERGHCGDGLGQLRVCGEYTHMCIRGPKNYTVDGKNVISGVRSRDLEVGPQSWTGERFEGTPQIVTRNPDGTVRTWRVDFDTPGSCLEGGYTESGWSFPIQLR